MHARILWTLINHPWHAIEQTAEKCIRSAPNSFSERVKPEQKVLLLLSNTILRVFFVLLLYISSPKFTVSPKQSMHVMPLCHNNSIFIICFVLTLCELRDFTQHPIYFFFLFCMSIVGRRRSMLPQHTTHKPTWKSNYMWGSAHYIRLQRNAARFAQSQTHSNNVLLFCIRFYLSSTFVLLLLSVRVEVQFDLWF